MAIQCDSGFVVDSKKFGVFLDGMWIWNVHHRLLKTMALISFQMWRNGLLIVRLDLFVHMSDKVKSRARPIVHMDMQWKVSYGRIFSLCFGGLEAVIF